MAATSSWVRSGSSGEEHDGDGGFCVTDTPEAKHAPPVLQAVAGAEKSFLSGRRHHAEDLESAVRFFLEFLQAFESFDFDRPCVTVFGSARFTETHRYYQLAREVGAGLARAGYAVM